MPSVSLGSIISAIGRDPNAFTVYASKSYSCSHTNLSKFFVIVTRFFSTIDSEAACWV